MRPMSLMVRMSLPVRLLALCLATLLTGCMVGPDYRKPEQPMPVQYKEIAGWKAATPADHLPRGAWWAIYDDPELDRLISQVSLSNQNIAQYQARYRQALALARQTRASLYPQVSGSGQVQRSGGGGSSNSSGNGNGGNGGIENSYSAQLSISWELDIWGKLRRQLQENKDQAQASAAELASATLSARSELAQNYFQLRTLDQRIHLYRTILDGYQGYLGVVENQYRAGRVTGDALAQARNQLLSTRASMLSLVWQRAQLEHAIALLIGKAPADFSLPADTHWSASVPVIPVGVPSRLLERRPDIASAERQIAAANEAIGVAVSGYFPDLTLSASGGYRSSQSSHLFSVANRFWSIGPALSGTILDFGATRAGVEQARAAYDEAVANYRQTVLQALGEVENYLVELSVTGKELNVRQGAAAAAQESARITRNRYEAGQIDFLDVATTAAASLNQQQNVLTLVGQRLVASVQLIAALGGSWQNPLGPAARETASNQR